jgi:hypothetical protein
MIFLKKSFESILTMKKIVAIYLIVFGIGGCKKEDPKTAILMRVENLTSMKLENVRIISYQEAEPLRIEKNYGDLSAGEVSGYQQHDLIRSSVEYIYSQSGTEEEVSSWCGTGVRYLGQGIYTLRLRLDYNAIIYEELIKN